MVLKQIANHSPTLYCKLWNRDCQYLVLTYSSEYRCSKYQVFHVTMATAHCLSFADIHISQHIIRAHDVGWTFGQ